MSGLDLKDVAKTLKHIDFVMFNTHRRRMDRRPAHEQQP